MIDCNKTEVNSFLANSVIAVSAFCKLSKNPNNWFIFLVLTSSKNTTFTFGCKLYLLKK